ncbi:hypothetical protein [Nitratiruptor sp. SB155-2]|uniref:hypothetical protein n=1 Tax=Nitratiruptor sp. (strain SB155-2) TaxID=387092 RepID=UPI00059C287D|nr:hypothetical protein [Nitratiruptor sp. SB155-2]
MLLGQPAQKSEVDIVLVALATPVLVGVYQDGKRIETIESHKKTSDILPSIFQSLMKQYEIKSVYFARGPGSFMSIKLVYIFLKTLQIAKGITLFGCDGFEFTDNQPIKAHGSHYFVKENDTISTKKLEGDGAVTFRLPDSIDEIRCSQENIAPLYVLPAVKV